MWAAREQLAERFLVIMGDHCYESAALAELMNASGDFVALGDSSPYLADPEEATLLEVQDGQAVAVGKELSSYNMVDAGAFVCSQSILPVLDACLAEGNDEWNDVKRAWLQQKPMRVVDVHGAFWADLDTKADLRAARKVLIRSLPRPRDGLVARWLNRRLSIPLSVALARARMTANQISLLAFVLALVGAGAFAIGRPLAVALGGLLTQASSVIDGCDGEVARLEGISSSYGAWLDSVLDRVADTALIIGMAWGYARTRESGLIWPLASLALAASLWLSYTETRYQATFSTNPPTGGLPAKRDARLFIIMLGGLLNRIPAVLGVIASLTTMEVVRRIWAYRPVALTQVPESVAVTTPEIPVVH
ncbi:MAG TPA: di-myo-inositol-1,3'-phosphate-1'-phosphate synthase [Anaerolineae bacterium]|nr:di-myo-inositol-1,3'-phosphate-1'-phosphate synthase [Anaerolineae bacterium]